MALTAHKTVAMFMCYVHTEDDPVRKAAELVATRRKPVVSAGASSLLRAHRARGWESVPVTGIVWRSR